MIPISNSEQEGFSMLSVQYLLENFIRLILSNKFKPCDQLPAGDQQQKIGTTILKSKAKDMSLRRAPPRGVQDIFQVYDVGLFV